MGTMTRFENQVAVVTGAGRGIGHAIALRLASEGARVASVSRTEANAQRTADEINASRNDAAKAYAVDVSDHAEVQKIGEHFEDSRSDRNVLSGHFVGGETRSVIILALVKNDAGDGFQAGDIGQQIGACSRDSSQHILL